MHLNRERHESAALALDVTADGKNRRKVAPRVLMVEVETGKRHPRQAGQEKDVARLVALREQLRGGGILRKDRRGGGVEDAEVGIVRRPDAGEGLALLVEHSERRIDLVPHGGLPRLGQAHPELLVAIDHGGDGPQLRKIRLAGRGAHHRSEIGDVQFNSHRIGTG